MKNSLFESMTVPLRLAVLMWLIFFFEFTYSYDFAYTFGLYPRSITGLIGIIFSPLLHGSYGHLISNTVPFLVLGTLLFWMYPRVANEVFLSIYFLTGVMVWVVARPSIHLGASGIVYGLASFLIFAGFFRRKFKLMLLSVVVLFFYGGIFYGVLPGSPQVSWESHLMGAVVGFWAAQNTGIKKKY
ncbi:MAG: rhomboid family intramembrane serine protease [Cyclobacteriaceae bacterium]|nr:rhomboid family intramembrane serine protease [Cyclobacteriaceae bacterium]